MTRDNDTQPLFAPSDIPAALGLLSRLPIHVDTHRAIARSAHAAWAYPVVGLILALIVGCVATFSLTVGLSPNLAAILTLAALTITTGALHEDGLSDTVDGLWGGWSKSRRLEIMKDSRIGAYGVIALILAYLLRWQALTIIFGTSIWAALIAVAMLSRASMVPLMTLLPNARDAGLSQTVGRPSFNTALTAVAIAALISLVLLQLKGLLLILAAAIAATLCARIAKSKIGGQTGDILGATQQISEIAMLLTLAAVL